MTIVINFCDFVADPILVLFGFVVFVVVVGYFFSLQCSSVDWSLQLIDPEFLCFQNYCQL